MNHTAESLFLCVTTAIEWSQLLSFLQLFSIFFIRHIKALALCWACGDNCTQSSMFFVVLMLNYSQSDNRIICYLQMAIVKPYTAFETQQSCCNRIQCHCSLSIINIHQIITAVIHCMEKCTRKTHDLHAYSQSYTHIHTNSHSSVHSEYHINASNLRVSPSVVIVLIIATNITLYTYYMYEHCD